jgi:hypothetical protein
MIGKHIWMSAPVILSLKYVFLSDFGPKMSLLTKICDTNISVSHDLIEVTKVDLEWGHQIQSISVINFDWYSVFMKVT